MPDMGWQKHTDAQDTAETGRALENLRDGLAWLADGWPALAADANALGKYVSTLLLAGEMAAARDQAGITPRDPNVIESKVHKARPSEPDPYHCAVCHQRIQRIPGGPKPKFIHTDTGAVAAAGPDPLDSPHRRMGGYERHPFVRQPENLESPICDECGFDSGNPLHR